MFRAVTGECRYIRNVATCVVGPITVGGGGSRLDKTGYPKGGEGVAQT